jgi:hypothetical protein
MSQNSGSLVWALRGNRDLVAAVARRKTHLLRSVRLVTAILWGARDTADATRSCQPFAFDWFFCAVTLMILSLFLPPDCAGAHTIRNDDNRRLQLLSISGIIAIFCSPPAAEIPTVMGADRALRDIRSLDKGTG